MTFLQERTEQLLTAVDNLLRVHDDWEADETAPVQPTAAFEIAIGEAIAVGDEGDIPAQCRDLCVALQRLGVEWEKFVNGLRTPDHRPIASFWGAFRDVIHSRAHSETKELKQPEPVSLLIEQKVPHNQIGRHIWGFQGKGPFINSLGQVDSTKILEEAKEPGKYTKGWVHPEQIARQRDSQRELSRRLGNASRREQVNAKVVEKASIVEMLKEGQYPDVIARVKNVSLEAVLEEARVYSISPAVRPNLAAERSSRELPTVPAGIGDAIANFDPMSGVDLTSAVDPEDEAASVDEFGAKELDQDDAVTNLGTPVVNEVPLDDLIRSLNDGHRGTAEIVAAVRESGRDVTFQQVKAAIKQQKA